MSDLAERYLRCCSTPSDIYEHLPVFVGVCEELNAKRVIELGVRHGVSTVAWLYGLQKTEGYLWSVDCSFPVPGPEFPGENLLDPQGPLGVIPWWTFLLGYDTWAAILDALPTSVDAVFLDTNHVYEETLVELELYVPRVRSGGCVLLHDTALEVTGNATTPQPAFPVRTAAEEFCAAHGLTFTNRTNCFGLGRIDVP